MKKFTDIFTKKRKTTTKQLFAWNRTLAIMHALQGVAVLVLANNVTFPITTSFLTLNPLSAGNSPELVSATQTLFDLNIAYLVAAFFFMSAIAHAYLASYGRKTYEKNLKKHINKTRWVEYAFSASTMMVAIALLTGIYDGSSLIMIFALTAAMNLCGLIMETWNQKARKVQWLGFIIGSMIGIVPWLVIGIALLHANLYGSGQVPTFVYAIYGSLFLFFNCFAVNMYLQYTRRGAWKDYLYGERVYMILSLVAKSALAWQVFFGALRP